MSEQDILSKCTDAFFYVQEKAVPAPIQEWYKPYSVDALKESAKDPDKLQKQESIVKELGFPSSGSLLLDRALAARDCGMKLQADDRRKSAQKLVDSAEDKLAEAILEGYDSVKLLHLGRGIGRLSNTSWDPPALDQDEKSILDGINKHPSLKAEVKASSVDKSDFSIVVSLKKKG